jgi:hypothetical protein
MQIVALGLKKQIIRLLFLSLIVAVVSVSTIGNAKEVEYGAVPGEKLVFNVHWMGVPGGRAEMTMGEAEEGKYNIKAMVKTIGVVSFFHPLRDTLRSVGDRLLDGGFRSSNFTRDQRRGKKSRKINVEFDQKNRLVTRTATYEKPTLINTTSNNVKDPVALFYAIRSLPKLIPNTTLQWLTVGRKEYKVLIKIGKPKKKSVPLGRYNVIPVKLIVPSDAGLVRQEEALTIWLSTDNRRMPLRVETRLSLGSVAADLVEFNDGRGGHGELSD